MELYEELRAMIREVDETLDGAKAKRHMGSTAGTSDMEGTLHSVRNRLDHLASKELARKGMGIIHQDVLKWVAGRLPATDQELESAPMVTGPFYEAEAGVDGVQIYLKAGDVEHRLELVPREDGLLPCPDCEGKSSCGPNGCSTCYNSGTICDGPVTDYIQDFRKVYIVKTKPDINGVITHGVHLSLSGAHDNAVDLADTLQAHTGRTIKKSGDADIWLAQDTPCSQFDGPLVAVETWHVKP